MAAWQQIASLMRSESLSAKEIAKIAGVAPSAVSKWKAGGGIKYDALRRLAVHFKTSEAYIQTGVEPGMQPPARTPIDQRDALAKMPMKEWHNEIRAFAERQVLHAGVNGVEDALVKLLINLDLTLQGSDHGQETRDALEQVIVRLTGQTKGAAE